MAPPPDHRLVFFGGQGSPSIFSSDTVKTVQDDIRAVVACNILLSKCHAAFLEEIASLDAEAKHLLAIDVTLFCSASDLLQPKVQYNTQPVLQATTIYLCQLLHYMGHIHRENQPCEQAFDILQETNGFSSGLIPAAVVANSRSSDEFMKNGVEGFRLAFWIAYRTFLWGLKIEPVKCLREDNNPEATMSLVTRGLSREQVEERLSKYFAEHIPEQKSQQASRRLQISAIANSGAVSISGPKADLCAFKADVTADITTAFAFVHGWYHGGNQMDVVVQEVNKDIRRRDICFNPCSTHAKPIRSTLDGTLIDASNVGEKEILPWLTRHLLVHCVNWHDTTHAIATSIGSLLENEPKATVEILSFGPSSGSLFPEFLPVNPRVTLVDLSPFKNGGNSDSSCDEKNSVAIIGMSVQLPKGEGLEALWKTLSQGLSAVQEIPSTRFQVSDYNLEDQDKPRSMPVTYGAFLEDPFTFDNAFFNISPREAYSMDPQQRLLLQGAQKALEDAGYVGDSSPTFQRASTGCYIGLATGDYTDNLRNDIDVFYSSGTLRAFHSGRISYFYKLSGPSIVTDTACSSSMVSIYQACRALQNGDCTAAIAGGINVITSPDMYLGLARGHFLSQTGGCKPFDATADGYCRAEGCVLFVLKRLADAVIEGDRIHGVIRNIVVNQSGNSHSITNPHSPTQTNLLKRLLRQANVDPRTIGVVEAHGTGTQAGDTREIDSLRTVFGPHVSAKRPLVVSSIKGNIGHCEAASGAAGLAKLLLMLRERTIPAQVGFNNINPKFADLEMSGFVIPRLTVPWIHSQRTPRRAVLNNFGAAGSNASLLLEDWVEHPKTQLGYSKRSAYIFALSARSARALKTAVDRHIEFLGGLDLPTSLADICYTAIARREIYDHRIALACSSVDDLVMQLQKNSVIISRPVQTAKTIVFVFSGQGAMYRSMGKELMTTSPTFRDAILSCDRIIQQLDCPSILDIISDEQGRMETWKEAKQLMSWHCACVALEYGLAKLFMSWGIMPDYVLGHSLGEYAALCVSGALSLEDTFRVVAFRARMMGNHCRASTSGLLACNLAPEDVEQMILENPGMAQLSVACLNSTSDCVIGGPLRDLQLFQIECKSQNSGIRTKLLEVPYAFHTSAMDPIVEPLKTLGKTVKFRVPTIPVISNVYGRSFQDRDYSADYFALHARQPVRFSEGLQSLQMEADLDGAIVLELGPQPTLLPMLPASISSTSTCLGTLQKGQDAWKSICKTMTAIFLRKTTVRWREVFNGTSSRVTSLPGHALEGSTFVRTYRESIQIVQDPMAKPLAGLELDLGRRGTGFHLLPWVNTMASSDNELVLETDMGTLGPLILGHDVGGTPICPASVFHELALEATQAMLAPVHTRVLLVNSMAFANPLVYSPAHEDKSLLTVVVVRVTRQAAAFGVEFRITSRSAQGSDETLHCNGSASLQDIQVGTPRWVKDESLVRRQSLHFSGIGKNNMSTFRTKVLYEAVFPRVVRYSREYQSLEYLHIAESNLEAIGSFKVQSALPDRCLTHPVFTDTLLHAAGFVANLAIRSDEVGICAGVEAIEIAYHDFDYSQQFKIYCSLLEIKNAILGDAIALNSAGKVVAVARGMEFKRLRLSTFRQSLSRHTIVSPATQQQDLMPKARLPPTSGLNTPLSSSSDDAMISHAMAHTRVTIEGVSQTLKNILLEVGGFAEDDIDFTKSLDELGIDSLMQIELVSMLARAYPGQHGLNHHALSECETLGAIDALLSSILQTEVAPVPPFATPRPIAVPPEYRPLPGDMTGKPVVLHTSQSGRVPICLFHDGSGQIDMYARLGSHDRTTYAFMDPYFGDDQRVQHNINGMAKQYVESLLMNTHHSSLILGGWSFGGVVAFEAARQLEARGFDVKGLILIDSPNPVDHEPLPPSIISKIVQPNPQHLGPRRKFAALEKEFSYNASLLGTYIAEPFTSVNGRRLKTVMLRSRETFNTEALCGVPYDWLSRQDTRTAAISAWRELVGGEVHVTSIPGNHFEPFSDGNIVETAAQLWNGCRYVEESDYLGL